MPVSEIHKNDVIRRVQRIEMQLNKTWQVLRPARSYKVRNTTATTLHQAKNNIKLSTKNYKSLKNSQLIKEIFFTHSHPSSVYFFLTFWMLLYMKY